MQFDRKTLRARRFALLSLVAFAAAAVAVYFFVRWRVHDRFWVTTDNAFVVGNIIPVQADATGVISEVLAEESQQVNKGEVLVRLDAQHARAALDQSEAQLAQSVRTVGALFASRRQACQKIVSRIALREKVRHDIARYREALPSGSVSRQTLQNAEDQLASLEADLHEGRAELQAVESRINNVTRTNHPDIEAAKAKYMEDYIEFARQSIKAPVSGYVAKRKAQVGLRVRPGDQLMTIVPLDYLWIEANLFENSMARVRPGQPVNISVDLYGNTAAYHGTVEGVIPGSGSVFALLAPDNATGNFIHIVQRVPVRISLRADEIEKQPLRPGLSSVISIDVSKTDLPVNASSAKPFEKDYKTNIFDNEPREANARIEKIIKENIVGAADAPAGACPTSE